MYTASEAYIYIVLSHLLLLGIKSMHQKESLVSKFKKGVLKEENGGLL